MDKKDLIQKYLEAETSVEEERELAKADKNVGLLAEALVAEPLADAAGEFAQLPDGQGERPVHHFALHRQLRLFVLQFGHAQHPALVSLLRGNSNPH